MSAAVQVAIVVVSWNTRELLCRCLDSLGAEAETGRAEVWVVDNASTDGTAELVRERYPWVHLIACSENLGFGPAVNLVAGRTESRWIVPANADVEFRTGTLRALLAAGKRHPRAGALAPRLQLPDGSTQHSVHHFPTLCFTAAFNLGLQRVVPRLGDALCLEGYWNPDRAREVEWALGALLLVRRRAWEEVGGFDPGQWMYAEDLDLCWRLAREGWTTRYVPEARAGHRSAASTGQLWGAALTSRWLEASYAWMERRRGRAVTAAYATLNLLGAALRLAWLRPLAALHPQRFAAACMEMRRWLRRHRFAFRSRNRAISERR